MKRINKIFGLSLSVAAVFGLASCSNEVGEPAGNGNVESSDVALNLVKAPDFYAWSGSEVLGDTRGFYEEEDENGDLKKYYVHDDEVEVNLSILNPHKIVNEETGAEEPKYGKENGGIEDLAAKLSVHVRKATNVTVTLPLPAKYVVDSDDLLIFNEHQHLANNIGEFVKAEHSATYTIGDKEVKAEVIIVAGDEESGSVTLNITGIDANVLKACTDKNHDGVNFEVYLYLEENAINSFSALKNELDKSTVSFTVDPTYYINAFNAKYDADGKKLKEVNPNDCTVGLETEEEIYTLVGENLAHTNGSSYNVIYVLASDENGADVHHGGNYDPFYEDETVVDEDSSNDTDHNSGQDQDDDEDDDEGDDEEGDQGQGNV